MAATPEKSAPPNPRLARVLREAGWILLLATGVYLALALGTYDRGDPGPFFSGSGAPVVNRAGALGAWVAEMLLYVFGFSAWWWAALAAWGVLRLYTRVEAWEILDRRSFAVSLSGFAILIAASCALEAMRLHTLKVSLPFTPGGVLGDVLAGPAAAALGFTGATLVLIAILAAAFSVFSGLSWIRFAEKVGAAIEWTVSSVRARIEARRDREVGQVAALVREEKVEVAKKIFEEHEPIRIVPPEVAIRKSERVAKEKQVPLFADLPDSPLPPIALLDPADSHVERPTPETLEYTSRLIERKLLDFNVQVKVVAAYPGPVITRYEVEPAVGVKGAQVVNLARDLARALSVTSIRIVETIPGTSCMGLEIPNAKREIVRLSEIIGSQAYADMHSRLTVAMGKDITGKPVVADLARMPHLLVAGTTGSGKSVAINAMILSLVYKSPASDVRLIMVDPKMLELSAYEGIPHLLAPVVTDMRQAAAALHWCVVEMDRRYKLMSTVSVRNLAGYNHKIREGIEKKQPLKHPFSLTPESPENLEEMPFIVVVIDELADLMMVAGKKVEELIARLAQKSRASGIHLILATQRPSVDVITGLIKANVPTRVAFQVSSKVDSRTILDQQGAESLLGQGDMLYLPPGAGHPQRVHGAYVSDAEVQRVVEHLKKQGEAQYVDGMLDDPELSETDSGGEAAGGEADPLYDQAVQIVLQNRRASISLVQRHLRIGYNRAARLIEDMERAGLVSSMASNGNREILAPARTEK
ncbi:MAG: DNA translocase FtsK 4TM domain-containing protein [Betaproteobacteria bacterium]|nr:DNA translocase FtsK 4TM domain-containing protein [Betaproteobacteria bacterium]